MNAIHTFFYFSSIYDKNQLNFGYQLEDREQNSLLQLEDREHSSLLQPENREHSSLLQLEDREHSSLLQEVFVYFGFCFATDFVLYF